MEKDESVHEYFLTMKELAGRGMIEPEALFNYTIQGINDNASNKTVLSGAKTVKEFKEKLKVHDKPEKLLKRKLVNLKRGNKM